MKRTILYIGLITLLYACAAYSQERCNHEDLIMSFLQKISSEDYIPTLGDFNEYFDNHSEIEVGLRDEVIRNNPNLSLSGDIKSKSLAIDLFLKHKSVQKLIVQKNINNSNWIIINQYAKGSDTIVYEIGVVGSQEVIKMQMINWKNKERCGIVDILDSSNKSILIKSPE